MKITADALLFDNDGTLVSSLESVDRCWTRWAAGVRHHGGGLRPGRTARPPGRRDQSPICSPPTACPRPWPRIDELEVEDVPGRGRSCCPAPSSCSAGLPADRWAVVTSATRAAGRGPPRRGRHPPETADRRRRHHPRQAGPRALSCSAAGELGVDPARCVVFEDAPAGLRRAAPPGCGPWPWPQRTSRSELVADVVVTDLLGRVRAGHATGEWRSPRPE